MDMDVDVDSSKTNSNSKDSKSEKEKGKRNLYVGSQALNYRKDHMDVIIFFLFWFNIKCVKLLVNCKLFFPIAIDVFALLQILEIGKRRMIVADPKGTNHFSSLAYTLFTVFYG